MIEVGSDHADVDSHPQCRLHVQWESGFNVLSSEWHVCF